MLDIDFSAPVFGLVDRLVVSADARPRIVDAIERLYPARLADHVERVIYDRYRVTIIGSVPIKMQFGNSQEIETREIAFCLRGEINKTTSHKKPRKKFVEDELKAYIPLPLKSNFPTPLTGTLPRLA